MTRPLRRMSLLIAAVLALAGCSVSVSGGAHGDSGTAVTSVVLRNGVHCAVLDGRETKAIDCDWSFGSRAQPTGVDPKGDGGTAITVVTLPNGTVCAVMDGKPGKALSCGWGP